MHSQITHSIPVYYIYKIQSTILGGFSLHLNNINTLHTLLQLVCLPILTGSQRLNVRIHVLTKAQCPLSTGRSCVSFSGTETCKYGSECGLELAHLDLNPGSKSWQLCDFGKVM